MKTSALAASLLATATVLNGCVVAPTPVAGTYYEESYYYDEPVWVAPPPPRVEYVGPPPVAGYVWIGGFWNWTGYRHEWVPGYWAAPRPGYYWAPHRWDRDGDRWRHGGGRWEPVGRPRSEPAPAPRLEQRPVQGDRYRYPAYERDNRPAPPPLQAPRSQAQPVPATPSSPPPVRVPREQPQPMQVAPAQAQPMPRPESGTRRHEREARPMAEQAPASFPDRGVAPAMGREARQPERTREPRDERPDRPRAEPRGDGSSRPVERR